MRSRSMDVRCRITRERVPTVLTRERAGARPLASRLSPLTSHQSSPLPHSRLRHTPLKLSSMLPDQKRNILRQFEVK